MKNTQYNNIWVIDDTLTTVAFFSKPELFSDLKENWCNLSICSFSSSSTLIQENKKPHFDLPILLSPISIFLFESYDIKLNYKKKEKGFDIKLILCMFVFRPLKTQLD